MSEEEKGFVIKDRRSFDEQGELKEEDVGKEQIKREEPEKKAHKEETAPPPLPEVNFSSLILSLSSTAFLHLGEIPDPVSGEKRKDLALAKHVIDTIGMLKEKTEGNLTKEEKPLIDNVLTDLRLRYVKAR